MTPFERAKVLQTQLDEVLAEPDDIEKANVLYVLAEMSRWYVTAEIRDQMQDISQRAQTEHKRLVDAGFHP